MMICTILLLASVLRCSLTQQSSTTVCEDKYEYCKGYGKSDLCGISFFSSDCPLTCGLCREGHPWTPWTLWSHCSSTCGIGSQVRTRTCRSSFCGIGNTRQSRFCNRGACPFFKQFSRWSLWSECSATCGEGERVRTRECQEAFSFAQLDWCERPERASELCNIKSCPVYSWLSWSNWDTCTKSCARGVQTRRRKCNIGPSTNCGSENVENQNCNDFPCLVEIIPEWSEWTPWSTCDQSCGTGLQYRVRTCNTGSDEDCGDVTREKQTCNIRNCSGCSPGDNFSRNLNVQCVASEYSTCGKTSHNGSIGGAQENRPTLPWMVHLQSGSVSCSGVLIHRQWVLTAAHCLASCDSSNIITATVGSLTTTNFSHTFPILNVVTHPRYKLNPLDGTKEHDIALLQLPQAVPLNLQISPICFSSVGVKPGDTCVVANWNSNNPVVSNETEFRVVENDQCSKGYSQAANDVICAGPNDSPSHVCGANGGGPLMCQMCKSCAYYVTGVTSYRPSDCKASGQKVVFTRVSCYWSWIQAILGFGFSVSDSC